MKGETSFRVVHESVLVPKSASHPRSGEGCAVGLGGGRLGLAYTSYVDKTWDHDPANLVWRTSDDGGLTWGPETMLLDHGDSMNVMSVSLFREESGRVLCLFLRKEAKGNILRCVPEIMSSDDDGKTWSAPRPIDDEDTYHVVNNDRLVRLSTGRLLVPSAHNPDYKISEGYSDKPTTCRVLFSDDGGRTWTRGGPTRINPAKAIPPQKATPEKLRLWHDLRAEAEGHVIANQEPGVVELHDGRLMMWCRSNLGHMFRAYSEDRGETWSPLVAVGELVTPCAPQSIPGNRPAAVRLQRPPWRRLRGQPRMGLADAAVAGRQRRLRTELENPRRHRGTRTQLLLHEHAFPRRQSAAFVLPVLRGKGRERERDQGKPVVAQDKDNRDQEHCGKVPAMKKIYAAAISAHDGKGRVDEKSMARLLERNIAHGVSGFFLLGSMGEGPVMPEKAADELVRVSCQIVGGRAATLAGLNTVGLEKALRRMEALSKTGVDHYVVHSPGLQDRVACPVKYLLSVADHADRDIYIYHLPTIGGLQMSAAQFRDVVGHPRVRGVKNSSGDMFLRKELLMLKDEVGFELFEGQEWSIDEALIVGCDGGLAGLVTLASKPMVAIAKAVDRGDIGEAVRLQRVLIDVFHGVYGPRVTNVVNGHKHALWRLGLLDNTETLYHLEPMTEADKLRVDACLEKHRGLLD